MTTTVIVGNCRHMCPAKERLMREREGLLHKFERSDVESPALAIPRSLGSRNRVRKAVFQGDVSKVVKTFARSAAGLDKTTPSDLRPADVLERTVEYLYSKILTVKTEPFGLIYDFIFDRLRAVRQDLVIQRMDGLPTIRILESIVRFHVYSGYRCRHELISTFDPQINHKHLIDNLKRLLYLYEVNSYKEVSRIEFESFYVILSPQSAEVLRRALTLRNQAEFKNEKNYQLATQMCLAYQSNNFVKYFKLLNLLPPLLCAAGFEHAIKLRRIAFQVIAKAYGTSTCKFPISVLKSMLLYPRQDHVEKDLKSLAVQILLGNSKKAEFAVFTKSTIFTSSQLEEINCELAPLFGSQCIMDPSHVDQAAILICTQLPLPPTINIKGQAEPEVRGDWFSDNED